MEKPDLELNGNTGQAVKPLDGQAENEDSEGKAPIGRPPLAEDDRRTILIRVLINKAEQETLRKAAAGVGVSTWLRQAGLEKAARRGGQG